MTKKVYIIDFDSLHHDRLLKSITAYVEAEEVEEAVKKVKAKYFDFESSRNVRIKNIKVIYDDSIDINFPDC